MNRYRLLLYILTLCVFLLACNAVFATVWPTNCKSPPRPAHGPCETDEDLKKIGEQTDAEEVAFASKKITDAGLAHLKRMKNLKILRMSSTPIGDVGLRHLRELKELREVVNLYDACHRRRARRVTAVAPGPRNPLSGQTTLPTRAWAMSAERRTL